MGARQQRAGARQLDRQVDLGPDAPCPAEMVERRPGVPPRLEVVCPPRLGAMRADLVKTRQILLNLTANASKFTHGGHIGLAVTRAADRGRDWLVFEVRDTGSG
jgi:signal transduction histidine kinase